MRISDWSSDVCSSDLLVLRRWRPPAGSFALLFGVVTLLFVGLDEFSQPSLVLAGVAGGLVIDLLAERSPAWIAVAAGVTLMWLGYFGLYQVAEGGRSEEHTSELQSLMRISYAVFCLKKKKRKRHTQINTA